MLSGLTISAPPAARCMLISPFFTVIWTRSTVLFFLFEFRSLLVMVFYCFDFNQFLNIYVLRYTVTALLF